MFVQKLNDKSDRSNKLLVFCGVEFKVQSLTFTGGIPQDSRSASYLASICECM